MDAFLTGFFTLTAALSTIFLKDYLDRKRAYQLTTKQKAIEAYILANRLLHSLNAKQASVARINFAF